MISRGAKRLGLAAAVALTLLAVLAPASPAASQQLKIRAVYLGGNITPPVSFVELQMTAPGQTLLNGQVLSIWNHDGSSNTNFVLNHDVANGADQSTILIGDQGVPSADFNVLMHSSLTASAAAGAVCYASIDCVSWGGASFTGNSSLPTSAGTPMSSGLNTTSVLIRTIARGCATALDEADDTNDSLADFTSGPFAYQNNASPPTDTPCAPPVSTTPAPSPTGQRAAALKKCKKKQGKKARKKCKRKASLLPV